jgi:molybdenum cofactor cytidylyltransferase
MANDTGWTLILAAGQSERFGGVKALATWKSGTLLSHTLELAGEHSGERICTVLGAHAEALRPVLNRGLHSENPNWQQGMGTSIAWGLQQILRRNPQVSLITILPVDQPLITVTHLRELAAQAAATEHCVLTAGLAGNEGPPAAVPSSYFRQVLELRGSLGLKSFLLKSQYETLFEPSALEDVDTPLALAELRSRSDLT